MDRRGTEVTAQYAYIWQYFFFSRADLKFTATIEVSANCSQSSYHCFQLLLNNPFTADSSTPPLPTRLKSLANLTTSKPKLTLRMRVTKSSAGAPRRRSSASKQFLELKNKAISPKDRPAFFYFFTLPGSAPRGKKWGKLGISNNVRRRKKEWHRQCKGVEHVWSPVTRFTSYAYKHERLAHLALMKIGITRPLRTCAGCKFPSSHFPISTRSGGRRHREIFEFYENQDIEELIWEVVEQCARFL
jgi:hypothetical protein